MAVFRTYARYYDLLYDQDKFERETGFVNSLLAEQGQAPDRLLDLGCGTGRHAQCLARLGHAVTGVDLSEDMLEAARSRHIPNAEFLQGDVRDIDLGRRFPTVVSLFHVMSYMIDEDSLARACSSAAKHLEPGGLFLFDFWHAPAVAALKPEERSRRIDIEVDGAGGLVILRRAIPEIIGPDRIDVTLELAVQDQDGQPLDTVRETHSMRAWNISQIEDALRACGLTAVESGGWLTRTPPTEADWGAYVLARADVNQ